MIRPATPLTLLLFAAFVLLLLSVLSAPVIHAIPLGTYKGTNFGVFGYCKADGSCSSIEIGYDTTSLGAASSFKLATATRSTLSSILVIHPVAAFLTLVMLVLAITSHFHAPSHSVRYLLLVFIVSIFTFLATLLAFLVDVLLFIPHMAWGTYIVLAALVLVALSSIVSCAMRRTLVGRKARQRRIAANAEMSGENYYNRQAQNDVDAAALAPVPPLATAPASDTASAAHLQPTLPLLGPTSSASAGGGPPSSFGGRSFDKKDDDTNDEQIPLTSQAGQMPAQYAPQQSGLRHDANPGAMLLMSGAAGGGASGLPPGRGTNRPPSIQRDQYGNPLPYGRGLTPPPPQDGGYGGGGRGGGGGYVGYDPRRGPPPVPGQRGGRGGGPGPGYRGGRGGGPGPSPYGPPGGRGGYGPPMGRGGYGPPARGRGFSGGPGGGPGGRGGYPGPGPNRGQGPPPSYRSDQPGGGPYYGGGGPSGSSSNLRGLSPGPGTFYGTGSAPNLSGAGGSYESFRTERTLSSNELPRAESPPPLPGMEDDGFVAGGAGGPGARGVAIGQAIEMDATTPRARQQRHSGRFHDDTDSEIAGMVGLQQDRSSRHEADRGQQQYVPARAEWSGTVAGGPSAGARATPSPPRPASEVYIEDVDPRFAEPSPAPVQAPLLQQPPQQRRPQRQQPMTTPYDDEPQGTRSPAESERSTFTSISQRGVNPRWNPPQPSSQPTMPSMMPRRAARDPNETLLNSNPDFSLGRRPGPGQSGGAVGAGPSRRLSGGANATGGGGGLIPGSAYPPMG